MMSTNIHCACGSQVLLTDLHNHMASCHSMKITYGPLYNMLGQYRRGTSQVQGGQTLAKNVFLILEQFNKNNN